MFYDYDNPLTKLINYIIMNFFKTFICVIFNMHILLIFFLNFNSCLFNNLKMNNCLKHHIWFFNSCVWIFSGLQTYGIWILIIFISHPILAVENIKEAKTIMLCWSIIVNDALPVCIFWRYYLTSLRHRS